MVYQLRPFGTRAQVSIVLKHWLEEETGLGLIGANGGRIPFEGWVEMQFQLASSTESSNPLTVPLLVARDEFEFPISGYNVIEEVIKDRDLVGGESADSFGEIMRSAFSEVKQEGITALVELVQSANVESLCALRSSKNNMTVPHG